MNTTIERRDAHSPKNLITEDYEFLYAADLKEPWAKHLDREFIALLNNVDPTNPHPEHSRCSHCGAVLRYTAWLRHIPTGYTITVGEQCLGNRFGRATAEFQKLRKAAELDRQRQRIKKYVEEFVESHPEIAFMALHPTYSQIQNSSNDGQHFQAYNEAAGPSKDNYFIANVAHKLVNYGELSERQIEACKKSHHIDIENAAKKAAREEEIKNKPEMEVPEGKIRITGKIISTKWVEDDFGGSLKMLVEDERGFRVWGTMPSKLQDEDISDDDTIAFTATVTRSDDDPTFGFFKRPTQSEVIK